MTSVNVQMAVQKGYVIVHPIVADNLPLYGLCKVGPGGLGQVLVHHASSEFRVGDLVLIGASISAMFSVPEGNNAQLECPRVACVEKNIIALVQTKSGGQIIG